MIKNNLKKLAFTIAEILLAMVILGIIFLLSVNTLQHSSQDRERSSQLMKLYPIMDNMINLIILEKMGVENVPFGEKTISEHDKFSQMLVKRLRVGEDCQETEEGCWAAITDNSGAQIDVNGFYKVRLVDGTALAIKTFEKCSGESVTVGDITYNNICMVMYADVNALDKPNKWEQDVFKFVYAMEGTKDSKIVTEEGFYPASDETMAIIEKPKESYTKDD